MGQSPSLHCGAFDVLLCSFDGQPSGLTDSSAAPLDYEFPAEDMPRLGISLTHWTTFIMQRGGESYFSGQTLRNVWTNVIAPLTEQGGTSYCQLLHSKRNFLAVGIAELYVTAGPESLFIDCYKAVNQLLSQRELSADTFVFFPLFSINWHADNRQSLTLSAQSARSMTLFNDSTLISFNEVDDNESDEDDEWQRQSTHEDVNAAALREVLLRGPWILKDTCIILRISTRHSALSSSSASSLSSSSSSLTISPTPEQQPPLQIAGLTVENLFDVLAARLLRGQLCVAFSPQHNSILLHLLRTHPVRTVAAIERSLDIEALLSVNQSDDGQDDTLNQESCRAEDIRLSPLSASRRQLRSLLSSMMGLDVLQQMLFKTVLRDLWQGLRIESSDSDSGDSASETGLRPQEEEVGLILCVARWLLLQMPLNAVHIAHGEELLSQSIARCEESVGTDSMLTARCRRATAEILAEAHWLQVMTVSVADDVKDSNAEAATGSEVAEADISALTVDHDIDEQAAQQTDNANQLHVEERNFVEVESVPSSNSDKPALPHSSDQLTDVDMECDDLEHTMGPSESLDLHDSLTKGLYLLSAGCEEWTERLGINDSLSLYAARSLAQYLLLHCHVDEFSEGIVSPQNDSDTVRTEDTSLGDLSRASRKALQREKEMDRLLLQCALCVHNENSLDNLYAQRMLLHVYRERGQFVDAEQWGETALRKYRIFFGSDAIETLSLSLELAEVQACTGQLERARLRLRECCDRAEQAWGPMHPLTLWAHSAIGFFYCKSGAFDRGEHFLAIYLAHSDDLWKSSVSLICNPTVLLRQLQRRKYVAMIAMAACCEYNHKYKRAMSWLRQLQSLLENAPKVTREALEYRLLRTSPSVDQWDAPEGYVSTPASHLLKESSLDLALLMLSSATAKSVDEGTSSSVHSGDSGRGGTAVTALLSDADILAYCNRKIADLQVKADAKSKTKELSLKQRQKQ